LGALLIEGQDLKLGRKIDLPNRDVRRNVYHGGGEIQDRCHTCVDQVLGDFLGRSRRRSNDSDRDALLGNDVFELVYMPYRLIAVLLAEERVIDIEEGRDAKAPLRKTFVRSQGTAEVSDPNDRDGPILGETELPSDLVEEVLDVVADTPGPIGAEVREILANLCRVYTRKPCELFGRDRHLALLLGHVEQAPEIDRQPGDRGFGDRAASHPHNPMSL
jgi:hypothetical protein